jgi:DNA polymerase-1
LSNWKSDIRNRKCKLCPLHESAEYVCLMGSGSRKSKVMVVGEAPGAREDEAHRAFVGPAGKLLTRLLGEAGFSRKEVYITNAAKCRPHRNAQPSRKEVKTCANAYLVEEIEKVRPDHILALGNSAIQGLLGKSGITKHRGKLYPLGDAVVFPTFHPAAALRNPKYGDTVHADFQRFGRLVRGEAADVSRTKVQVCRTTAHLNTLRRKLADAREITFDIETYNPTPDWGLDPWRDGSVITSIAFTWEEGQGAVVPLCHPSAKWRKKWVKALHVFKDVLEDPTKKYIAHNGKFDTKFLAYFGVFIPLTFCTMIAAHLVNENRLVGLKPLSEVILGADPYDIGEDVTNSYNVSLKRLATYNAKDTDYTHRLKPILKKQLLEDRRQARIFKKIMMPASTVVAKMETAGIYMDPERWEERRAITVERADRVEAAMRRKVPRLRRDSFNFKSPKQLAWLFFEIRGNDIVETTKSGAASTKEAVLLRLAARDKLARRLIEYRKQTGYLSRYFDAWPKYTDENSRIHANFNLAKTVTGRLSSDKPNLQQVPRDPFMRGILGAAPGYVLLSADYSQIELRIAATLAGEKRMLRAFATGEDLHRTLAARMLKEGGRAKRAEDLTMEERKVGKSGNFGFVFGMGGSKYQEYAWDKFELDITEEEGWAFYRIYHKLYPALAGWHDHQRRLARRRGLVRSPLGRARHLPDVRSDNEGTRAEAERQAINSPVQSTATDLMLLSAVRIDSQVSARDARLVGSFHDALAYEVRADAVDEVAPVIKETMEDMDYIEKTFGWRPACPIEADIVVGTHWGSEYE